MEFACVSKKSNLVFIPLSSNDAARTIHPLALFFICELLLGSLSSFQSIQKSCHCGKVCKLRGNSKDVKNIVLCLKAVHNNAKSTDQGNYKIRELPLLDDKYSFYCTGRCVKCPYAASSRTFATKPAFLGFLNFTTFCFWGSKNAEYFLNCFSCKSEGVGVFFCQAV